MPDCVEDIWNVRGRMEEIIVTKKCEVCGKEIPIAKYRCSRECLRKSLVSGLFLTKTKESKFKRKIDIITTRTH